MRLAGAPTSHLVMNVCALMLGFLTVGLVATGAKTGSLRWGPVSLLLGAMLMLTSLFGNGVEGATRWISIGGLSVQSSLLIVPLVVIVFARQRTASTTLAIVLTSLALAIQPDRGMSGALAAGMAALALARPERNVVIAAGVSCGGLAASLLQTDARPAMPYVDQIFFSSFAVHPLAGLAVWAGAGLLIAPAMVGVLSRGPGRDVFFVFGAVWGAIAVAAALGNYPTPLVGYGGSAIIGYVVCMLGLPRTPKRYVQAGTHAMTGEGEPPQDLRVALA
jgi:cell division protein FtsW (lipid II flippase)